MTMEVEIRLAQSWPPHEWRDVTVLLAISGGCDSVALARAMASLKTAGTGQLLAAHFNHHLRAEESDADEDFVRQVCRRLHIPCEIGHAAPTLGQAAGGEGLEAVARKARYDFFRAVAARCGARYLVTGHTADDQVETILHRIIRGTGIGGLSGMARSRPLSEATTLIRPLLATRRSELIRYLDELKQPYRADSSNASIQFTRNRIRHELLPLLAERFNPTIDEAVLRLGALAADAQAVIAGLAEQLTDAAVEQDACAVWIDIATVIAQPRHLVRELLLGVWRRRGWPLQSMGYAEWDELAGMLTRDGPGKKKVFPGGVLAERTDGQLCLRRAEDTPEEPVAEAEVE
jgi:tRNA(Ile)-lysidine synthase